MTGVCPCNPHRFHGTHYEIGLQHGEIFKNELHEVEKVMLKRVVNLDFLKELILGYFGKRMLPYIPKEFRQEMEGIAKAGGVSFDTVYFLNLFPDIAASPPVALFRKYLPNFLPTMDSCTIVAISGERTIKNGILIGRNLDFGFAELLQDFIRFAVYQPTGRYAFFTITFPGFIGVLTAYSDHGIFLCESSINCYRSYRKAMPLGILFRQALEGAKSLKEMQKRLIQGERSREANVFLADRSQGVLLELTLRDYREIPLTNGHILFAANHFQSRKFWLPLWRLVKRNPFLDFRQKVFDEYLAGNPQAQGVEDVRKLMKRLGKGSGYSSKTIYSLVFEPDSLTGLIAYRGGVPATDKEYFSFSLSGIFKGDSRSEFNESIYPAEITGL